LLIRIGLIHPQNFSLEFIEFVNSCLIKDPKTRASATGLLELPIFVNVDNSSIVALAKAHDCWIGWSFDDSSILESSYSLSTSATDIQTANENIKDIEKTIEITEIENDFLEPTNSNIIDNHNVEIINYDIIDKVDDIKNTNEVPTINYDHDLFLQKLQQYSESQNNNGGNMESPSTLNRQRIIEGNSSSSSNNIANRISSLPASNSSSPAHHRSYSPSPRNDVTGMKLSSCSSEDDQFEDV
jgi:hypothetical protein